MPTWPEEGFSDLTQARIWGNNFTGWYNEVYRHSGINYVTPGQRHRGEGKMILKQRDAVYRQAKLTRPERWSRSTRNW
ncbi:integrase [Xenorhabdus mauleonii]|uniref:Integrase n=1 Tax=Xenorhabdus mauleonii TaxID=351675 RepID=A0A1I3SJD3_9GAMM|nr:integrase [Xenorhabdus mauleonii]SFJ58858.1 putative transposase [Xenorhabdus mauleonii]